jgi:hypothetical protein
VKPTSWFASHASVIKSKASRRDKLSAAAAANAANGTAQARPRLKTTLAPTSNPNHSE